MKIKILAGDFIKGEYDVFFGSASRFGSGEIQLEGNIDSLEIVTEENKKKIAGTLGAGVVGGLLFGPLGVLGGWLVGGKKKEVTFICILKDGKKFLGITKNKNYQKLLALSF